MLPNDGEDLLQQLSGELGIPEFLEDLPLLDETDISHSGTLYDGLLSDMPAITSSGGVGSSSVFSGAPMDTTEMIDHGIGGGDTNFTIDFSAFPPSPSDSDSSHTSSDVKDKVLSFNEVSPPVSPMTNIVSVSDLSNVKIPIPKIQKPSKWR